jgi:hypothetical protein
METVMPTLNTKHVHPAFPKRQPTSMVELHPTVSYPSYGLALFMAMFMIICAIGYGAVIYTYLFAPKGHTITTMFSMDIAHFILIPSYGLILYANCLVMFYRSK